MKLTLCILQLTWLVLHRSETTEKQPCHVAFGNQQSICKPHPLKALLKLLSATGLAST